MSVDLRFVLCEPSSTKRETLNKMLSSLDSLWLEAECTSYISVEDVFSSSSPDLLVIGIDDHTEDAIAVIRHVVSQSPSTSVIAVSSRNDGQTILETMRAGAKEFVNAPVEMAELASAIQRVTNSAAVKSKRSSNTLIAVAGVTGGVGTTSIAVNLAASIAANPSNSVALVDLDLSVGDADIFLDCIPEYTLLDVANNVARLDLSLLKKSMTKHESGVYLLPRPVSLQDNETINPENMSRVLGLLKATFTHLVVDVSKYYSQVDLTALTAADHILVVTQLDLPCLRNVVRLLMSLDEYRGLKNKVKIVVNRAGLSNNQISIKKAEETIGQTSFWQIPNDYAAMAEVRNTGVPLIQLSPRAAITQSLQQMAYKLLGDDVAAPEVGTSLQDGKNNWLGFLSKK